MNFIQITPGRLVSANGKYAKKDVVVFIERNFVVSLAVTRTNSTYDPKIKYVDTPPAALIKALVDHPSPAFKIT